ncbi:sensor histidine kinase [Consotaella salsifontis]|uniref:histidine kinase n=1 Tax=Consotaella salsifontis TaxID=1365950 RepID=A0A1T4SMG3_9HYPH|nr:ATP-binding protein [Consotaella salsifontis]SKA29336.1 Signal transduction histidine kinase [Consotaella salsifontis]
MNSHRSLFSLIGWRILAFAGLAATLQTALVFAEYWFKDGELGSLLIAQETEIVAQNYWDDPVHFPGASLINRYDLHQPWHKGGPGYALRVRQADEQVIYSSCGEACDRFPPLQVDSGMFWQRALNWGKPLDVVGGQVVELNGHPPLRIEFLSLGDPNNLLLEVLGGEVVEHMVIPTLVTLGLVFGGMLLSIREALRPVAATAEAARALDPTKRIDPLPTEGMPREIAHLTGAVNQALDRVSDLIRSQRVFSASIAHEIRTPLAIVKLELEQIEGPRARAAEADLGQLTHTLEQLTALARLDVVEPSSFADVRLGNLAEATVEQLAPLVFASGRSIGLDKRTDPEVRAVPTLISTLMRNLVENAVKHTPVGTAIEIAVEAPARLIVRDNGPGMPSAPRGEQTEIGEVKRSGSLGVGLKIAQRIAALHEATLRIVSAEGGGTKITIDLSSSLLESGGNASV